jgi:hypothetical protein
MRLRKSSLILLKRETVESKAYTLDPALNVMVDRSEVVHVEVVAHVSSSSCRVCGHMA